MADHSHVLHDRKLGEDLRLIHLHHARRHLKSAERQVLSNTGAELSSLVVAKEKQTRDTATERNIAQPRRFRPKRAALH